MPKLPRLTPQEAESMLLNLIEIPIKTIDEPRYLVVGKISGKHWSGIIIYRKEKIRIISVRRSRKEEVEFYEG